MFFTDIHAKHANRSTICCGQSVKLMDVKSNGMSFTGLTVQQNFLYQLIGQLANIISRINSPTYRPLSLNWSTVQFNVFY